MLNFNFLKELFLPDKHWSFWKRGLSWSILGWITQSTHHSFNFAHGAEAWEQDKQGLCTVPALQKQFFPRRDVWTPAGKGGLAAFGSGRWRADGKCLSVSRGTNVFCCSSGHLWHRFVEMQSKGKLKLKMRKWFREIYVVFYQRIHNWLFLKN